MINDKAVADLIQKILKGQNQIGADIKLIRSDIGNVNDEVIDLKSKVDNHTKRIDTIGKQLANLDDDSPTIEDFNNLTHRVTKIEQNMIFA